MPGSDPNRARNAHPAHSNHESPSGRLAHLLGAGTQTETALLSDSAWALKLKEVSEAAAHQLDVHVISARLVRIYEALDRDAALFELETETGRIQAILSRTGEYSFFWKR